MKKVLSILLTIFMFVSNTCVTLANENVEFYAYTTNTEGFDAYAKEELSTHIYTYYGYFDNTLKLGKGINVYGDVENPFVVYPIWKNNDIVATFNVVYYDGQYSGSYSTGNAEQLNYAKEISTFDHPIKLVKTDEEYMYVVNEVAYDMTSGYGKVLDDVNIPKLSTTKLTKIDATNTLEYTKMSNTRAATSWNLSWNPTEHFGNSVAYCYAYTLSPILRGLGYSSYTYTKIKNDIEARAGALRPGVSFSELCSYLTSQGFSYYSNSSGYLSGANVASWIYDARMYVMIGLTCLTASSTSKHFCAITGYTNNNGTYTYQVYDPQHNGTNGKCTMSSSTRTFTNSDGSQFKWDAGYITNFDK